MRAISDIKKLDAALAGRRGVGLEAADFKQAIGAAARASSKKKPRKR